MLYRSSMLYDAAQDVIRIYISGQGAGKTWRAAMLQYRGAAFFSALEKGIADPAALVAVAGRDMRDSGP